MGSPGHAVVPVINEALQAWSYERMRTVLYLNKGISSLSDTHSALQGDVHLPIDVSTHFNKEFFDKIELSRQVNILPCTYSMLYNAEVDYHFDYS